MFFQGAKVDCNKGSVVLDGGDLVQRDLEELARWRKAFADVWSRPEEAGQALKVYKADVTCLKIELDHCKNESKS